MSINDEWMLDPDAWFQHSQLAGRYRALEAQNVDLREIVRSLARCNITAAYAVWSSYPAIARAMRAQAIQTLVAVENLMPQSPPDQSTTERPASHAIDPDKRA